MSINSDIRDHAYQFFIEEAPELLEILEAGLLTLNQRSTAKVHNLMRAAHSLKGGAASVGLDTIATLAHRLENILKALYSDSLEVDLTLENDLLRAYDCLRVPLMEQITTGQFDPEALAIADPIFTQIELRCGEALLQTETYLPSSTELGVDMVTSIFEVDVVQGLDRLATILNHPQDYEVVGELRAQLEIFVGFAELLNLPEFKMIAETAQQALNTHPDRAIEITQLTLLDLERSRQSVLAGDRTQGLKPSAALMVLASSAMVAAPPIPRADVASSDASFDVPSVSLPSVSTVPMDVPSLGETDDMVAAESLTVSQPQLAHLFGVFGGEDLTADLGIAPEEAIAQIDITESDITEINSSDSDTADTQVEAIESLTASRPQLESLFGLFGGTVISPEPPIVQDDSYDGEEVLDSTVQLTSDQSTAASFVLDQSEMLEEAVLPNTVPLDYSTAAELDIAEVDAAEVMDADWVAAQNPDEQPLEHSGRLVPLTSSQPNELQVEQTHHRSAHRQRHESTAAHPVKPTTPSTLTVRVDSERLERMSNLVGELSINRNGLSLQNEQLQAVLRELLNRFSKFEEIVTHLRESLDQMLVAPEYKNYASVSSTQSKIDPSKIQNGGSIIRTDSQPRSATDQSSLMPIATEFDSLEMDSYGVLHAQLQEILESFVQLDETVDDVTLYARQSDRLLDQHRHLLTNLSSELTQSRMLPLGEVLNRFPRVLRDLSATYHKPVNLKLIGTSLLVDRAILEKLYDPLLHLLRNAFDHGIEFASMREQLGKPKVGQIEIRAYYKGNQTIIEIKDDGQGLNLDRIRNRAFELGLLSAERLLTTPSDQLFELIFEPGFSTAPQVSELSGRGIGLDVVRSQLQLIKGSVTVTSSARQGTTFTLRLPLTLTNTKLIICSVGSTTLALPLDSVEEIVTPQIEQTRQSGTQRFLSWREQIIPTYRLADLLDYACPLPEAPTSKSWSPLSPAKTLAAPMLVLNQQEQRFAIEVDQLITEQELVIKSFGALLKPPSYLYGCTSLGDGSLIPVIDSSALLAFEREQKTIAAATPEVHKSLVNVQRQASGHKSSTVVQIVQSTTILVVDDAVTLRRTLALSLERAGFRVLQARDGQEAINQCQHSSVQLIICDIEMPNMNGFEFLSYRRQDPQIANIPIVMLTSRSNDKHRWLAMQLGATNYFTKPYLEQEFLTAIKTLFSTT